jgi:cytosine deaminase
MAGLTKGVIATRARAAAANLGNYGLKVGRPANLVVLDQQSVAEVLRFHAPPAAAISHEPLVDAKKMRELAQPGPG